ncbi:hypothetical protein EKO27_g12096, partial [Xylaria grammica]
MPTLLHVLTRKNEPVDATRVNRGGNTTIVSPIWVEGWTRWADFDHATLTQIFEAELASPYAGGKAATPLPKDRVLYNERSLEDFLRIYLAPVVNSALDTQD